MPDPSITSFTATPTRITVGASIRLAWDIAHATAQTEISIEGAPAGPPLRPTGDLTVTPAAGTITYKLIIRDAGVGPDFYDSSQVLVNVAPARGAGAGGVASRPAAAARKPDIKYENPVVVTGDDPPAFSPNAAWAEMDVGMEIVPGRREYAKKRVRLAYHLFEVEGVNHADLMRFVRLRTYRWVRRVYAAANIAPRIVEINDTALPTPIPYMISFVNWQAGYKDLPTGKDSANATSKLVILLNYEGRDISVDVNLAAGMTPGQMAQAAKAALEATEDPPGTRLFRATIENAPLVKEKDSMSQLKTIEACDVFVTKVTDGTAVPIKKVSDTDTKKVVNNQVVQVPGLTSGRDGLEAPAKASDGFALSNNDGLPGGDPSQRRVLRMGRPGEDTATRPADDRIDIYVVPKMALAGRAYPGYPVKPSVPGQPDKHVTGPDYLPSTHLKNAVIMAWIAPVEQKANIKAMDENDTAPFTLPHEICHVLAQTGHTEVEGDVMAGNYWPMHPKDSGGVRGEPDGNGACAAKHIYGPTLLTGSPDLKENETGIGGTEQNQDMVKWMHERGAHLLAAW